MSTIQGEKQEKAAPGAVDPGAGLPGSGKASFALGVHNPDVLTCIANLSNDEVFTPPAFANEMLDTLENAWAKEHDGRSIWGDPTVTFLDPFTKSGVFLREITQRLTNGLAKVIPDLQQRVDHILTQQVFGIGITQLTALLARRSVYCSKDATGRHSIATGFERDWGNIWFERTEHTWVNRKKVRQANPLTNDDEVVEQVGTGKCRFCGAAEAEYARDDVLETHAYAFIHTDDIKSRLVDIFGVDMQFDVIIGNPPYQLGSNGGTRDVPIYQNFVEQAKRLNPRYLTMVIPSRWMATGLGLKEFRVNMLTDRSLRNLSDYPAASDVFPGVEVKAGVCFFLRDAGWSGDCLVTTVRGANSYGPISRDLGEFDILVRESRALSILRKVRALDEPSVNLILARDKEFGWTSNFNEFQRIPAAGDVPLYYIRKMNRHVGYVKRQQVTKSAALIDTWKLLVPESLSSVLCKWCARF